MELKTCPNCQKPHLASLEQCPHCPPDYEWNQESWANVGCLLGMMLFVFLMVLLPLLMIAGMFLRF
ncbi:MAG TPA: hypothetical protein VEX64_05335 [Pyrinomonadaceae bacterium]|nr:hypothetical protein [Pyrinomonadaceae bacterium]